MATEFRNRLKNFTQTFTKIAIFAATSVLNNPKVLSPKLNSTFIGWILHHQNHDWFMNHFWSNCYILDWTNYLSDAVISNQSKTTIIPWFKTRSQVQIHNPIQNEETNAPPPLPAGYSVSPAPPFNFQEQLHTSHTHFKLQILPFPYIPTHNPYISSVVFSPLITFVIWRGGAGLLFATVCEPIMARFDRNSSNSELVIGIASPLVWIVGDWYDGGRFAAASRAARSCASSSD